MTAPDLITGGMLDFVERRGSLLRIGGWVVNGTTASLTGFCVSVARQPREVTRTTLDLESPDIEKLEPGCAGADRCRFVVEVEVGGDPLANTPIEVHPTFDAGIGCSLFQVVEPAIVMPAESVVGAVGGGRLAGLLFLGLFVNLADLQPHESVLDVGCGVGRMAWPLSFFLDDRGVYLGFDIVKASVAWAADHFAGAFPNAHFVHADMRNELYNPGGRLDPAGFAFPVAPASVDFVFLASVFTHMRGAEVRHYLGEIAQVLRKNGRALVTSFVLDDEVHERMRAGRTGHSFATPWGDGLVQNPDAPEGAVAFAREDLTGWIGDAGLTVRNVYPGAWSGRIAAPTYQDVLVLEQSQEDRAADPHSGADSDRGS